MGKHAIHDIRLSFTFNQLWPILYASSFSPLIKNTDIRNNKDITLHDIDPVDQILKTIAHKTDTVLIIVACTFNPIPIDIFRLIKLTSSLTRVEDRLQLLVSQYNSASIQNGGQQYLSLKLKIICKCRISFVCKLTL